MARINMDELDNYGGGSGGGFFKLSVDKETAQVRIMLDKPEDISNYIYGIHDVEIDGRKRYVNCLRAYNDPIDKCPFCENGMKIVPKIFVPLYNIDKNEMQIFDRGKKFMSKLSGFMSRYSKPSIVSHVVEIERNGKPKDMQTTYELYEIEEDGSKLEDFDEFPEILGGIVLDKSADDMNYYLDTGDFPPEDDEESVRRRSSRKEAEEEEEPPFEEEEKLARRSGGRSDSNERSSRRTPSNGRSRRSF